MSGIIWGQEPKTGKDCKLPVTEVEILQVKTLPGQ